MFTSSLGYVTEYGLAFHADDPALIAGDDVLTYADLDRRASQVGNALLDCGLRPGDRVAIVARNDLRYVELMLGVMRAAAVPAPINPELPHATILALLGDMAASVVVLGAEQSLALEPGHTPALVIRLGGVLAEDSPGTVDFDVWRDAAASVRPVPRETENIALQLCTSGSTGLPKSVLMPHHMVLEMVRMMGVAALIQPSDRAVVSTPLFHLNASMMGVLLPLMHGASAVVLPGFDAAEVLSTVEEHRCTYLQGVPATYRMLLDEVEAAPHRDLTSIQFISCGSAPMPRELLSRLDAVFDGVDLMEGYGLTECGTLTMNPRWSTPRHGSIGLAVPGYELRVVDADGSDVPDGTPGELWARGAAMMAGYAGRPELTQARFAAGGWFRTHDIVRREPDGYFFFEGRVDDRINVAGEHVYPRQVETLLVGHPQVREAIVVGVPHPIKGQVPVAFVVADGDLGPEDVKKYFFTVGPAYAHPRHVIVVPEMPLVGTGKVDRSRLSRLAADLAAPIRTPD